MPDKTAATRTLPGTSLIIALLAALVGWAIWSASKRTVPVDDAIVRATHGDGPAAATSPGSPARGAWPDMRIDINRANAAELALLPGLGDRLAQRVIDERERSGRFTTVDDLERVSGMGPTIIERLRPYVVAE